MAKYLIFTILLTFTSQAQQSINYRMWSGDSSESYQFVLNGNQVSRIIYGGDSSYPAQQCEEAGMMVCFRGVRHSFAIPENFGVQREWRAFGSKYKLIDTTELKLLGKVIPDVFVVVSPSDVTLAGRSNRKGTMWLYSEKFGLLGFGKEGDGITYWLDSEYGIGSASKTSLKQ